MECTACGATEDLKMGAAQDVVEHEGVLYMLREEGFACLACGKWNARPETATCERNVLSGPCGCDCNTLQIPCALVKVNA